MGISLTINFTGEPFLSEEYCVSSAVVLSDNRKYIIRDCVIILETGHTVQMFFKQWFTKIIIFYTI